MPEPIPHPRDSRGRRQLAISATDYEAFRADLDLANGFPADVGSRAATLTTIPPLSEMQEDDGSVYLTLASHDDRLIDADAYAAHADAIEEAEEWDQAKPGGYAVGAFVIWQDRAYRNFLPNNVWRPDVAGWRDPRDVPTWSQPVAAEDAWPLDAIVFWRGKKWQSNVPANVWEPGASGITQWDDVTETPPTTGPAQWEAGQTYAIGDEREHEGVLYRCRQPHTSLAIYPPPIVPALWLKSP